MRTFRTLLTTLSLIAVATTANLAGSTSLGAGGKAEMSRMRWKNRTIEIAISNSLIEPNSNIKTNSDVVGAFERAVSSWQTVADIQIRTQFSERSNVSPSGPAGDDVSLVTVAQSAENVLLFSKNPLAESAKTRVFYSKGLITEADIVLNPFQQFSTDGTFGTFDLESTFAHEIGHLLGLRHSRVLGSTMSENISRNGVFGLSDTSARSLSASDVTAVRELYGTTGEDEECCGTISGRLNVTGGKAAKNLRVWAEEDGSGRVVAQTETALDGIFRIGGLSGGNYSVFWQKNDDIAASAVGNLGNIKLEAGENRNLTEKVSLKRSETALTYVGINGQLSDTAITLESGREYVVYLGGRNLAAKDLKLEFNSRFFSVARGSIVEQDFGDNVSVISCVISVDEKAPSGVYTIFSSNAAGLTGSLIGAINIK